MLGSRRAPTRQVIPGHKKFQHQREAIKKGADQPKDTHPNDQSEDVVAGSVGNTTTDCESRQLRCSIATVPSTLSREPLSVRPAPQGLHTAGPEAPGRESSIRKGKDEQSATGKGSQPNSNDG